MTTDEQINKLHRLQYVLADCEPFVIAVSGGLDSRLLAFLAKDMDLDARAVHFSGPHVPNGITAGAVAWLRELGMDFEVLTTDPLALPEVAANARDRCYHCKRQMFMALRGLVGETMLVDGSNATDLQGYRPGLRALSELAVYSPYADCGVDKDDIRALAAYVGLDHPDQPAAPCLLTRMDYGVAVSAADLARIDALEGACRAAGYEDFRVRMLGAEPVLFVQGADRGLVPPEGLQVRFMGNLSGYWDRR